MTTTEKTMLPELRVERQIGTLSWNFKEINKQLDIQLEKYRGLVVEPDQIKEAKTLRADLRRLSKAINDMKLEEKKEFCQPYTIFEDQVKEVRGKIDDVAGAIDGQIKKFEEQEKKEKLETIKAYYAENGDKSLDFDFLVFEESWLNKTCSDATWKSEIDKKVERFRNELTIICQMDDPRKKDFLITDMTKTGDLTKSLANWERQLEAERKTEELRRQQEEAQARRAAAEAERRAQEAAKAAQEQTKEPQPEGKPDPRDYLYTREFRITDATYDQMLSVFNFMKNLGINYETLQKSSRRK